MTNETFLENEPQQDDTSEIEALADAIIDAIREWNEGRIQCDCSDITIE